MTDTRVGIIITARDQAGAVFKNLQKESGAFSKNAVKHFDAVKKRVFSLQTALLGLVGGYGLKKVASSFLEAARTTENYNVRLQILLGSVEEGNRLFKEMSEYAGKVPFEFEQIMGSATQLAGVMKGGVDEIKTWMPLIGDLAAASGLDIRTTTEQFIRMYSAGAASADLFRERGITAMLGFKAGVSYSADETRKKLLEAWNKADSQFRGATDKMASTWDGMMSMVMDKWYQFRNLIMEAGVFDELKTDLDDINKRFGEWITNNDELIKQKVETWVDGVTESIKRMYSTYKSLPEGVIGAGGVGLIVAIVGKSSKIGALAAAIALLNTELSNFDLNITSLPEKYRELDKAIDNIWDVITGKREWRTGQLLNEEGRPYVRGPIIKTATGPEGTGTETGGGAGTPGPTNWVEDLTDEEVAAYKRGWEQEEHLLSVYLDNKKTMIDDAAEAQKRAYEYEEMLVNRYLENKQTAIDEADEYYSQMIDDLNSKHLDTSNYMIELSERTAEAMEQNFSDLFFDMMQGEFKGLEDYGKAILQSLQRATADLMGQLAREGLFGADNKSGILGGIIQGIGSFFGAPGSESMIGKETITGHSGGVVGSDKFASRWVNPAIFATARRAHSGLGPGEIPIIGREEEGIFTPGQMKALGISITSSKNTAGDMHLHLDAIHIHAVDAKSFHELAGRNPEAIVQPFISAIESGDRELINRIKGIVY